VFDCPDQMPGRQTPHPLRVSTWISVQDLRGSIPRNCLRRHFTICSVFVRMTTLKRSGVHSATLQGRITLIRIPAIRMHLSGSGELSPRMGSFARRSSGVLTTDCWRSNARGVAPSSCTPSFLTRSRLSPLPSLWSAATRCSHTCRSHRSGRSSRICGAQAGHDGRPIDAGPKLLTGTNHPKGSRNTAR
jgi:hypothetical protein